MACAQGMRVVILCIAMDTRYTTSKHATHRSGYSFVGKMEVAKIKTKSDYEGRQFQGKNFLLINIPPIISFSQRKKSSLTCGYS